MPVHANSAPVSPSAATPTASILTELALLRADLTAQHAELLRSLTVLEEIAACADRLNTNLRDAIADEVTR